MNRTQEILAFLLVSPDLLDDPNLKDELFAEGFDRQLFIAARRLNSETGETDWSELPRAKELSKWKDRTSRIAALSDGTHKITDTVAFQRKIVIAWKSMAALTFVNSIKDVGSTIAGEVDPDFNDLDTAAREYIATIDSLLDDERLRLLCFEDIPEEKIKWHVPGVYACGMIHSLGGVQGHGKSLHLIDLAAKTSTGAEWPITGTSIPKGDVLYITDEDSRDKIIKPRLRLAGADMSKVFIPDFDIESLALPEDEGKILAWLRTLKNPKLLILDPIVDYSTGSLNVAENATKIIKSLKRIADKTGICVIYSVHFNKNVDLDSVHRVAHSYTLTSKPRLAWLIIKQDAGDDLNPHRILCCGKTAFKPILNMMFTIKGDKLDTPYIDDWRTAKIQTADALATGDRRRDIKVEEAEEFLLNNLNDQWKYVDDIKEIAEKEGINMRTVYRASKNLSIEDDWDGKRKMWKLEAKK